MYQEILNNGILFESQGFPGGQASGLSVLGLAADEFACGNYRISYPLQILASQGARVKVVVLGQGHPSVSMEDLLAYDIIYTQRFSDQVLLGMLQDVRMARGSTLVYDLDDYLHGVPDSSVVYESYDPKTAMGRSTLEGLTAFLDAADIITVSTRELAALYSQYSDKIHVLQNGLDLTFGQRNWSADRLPWKDEAFKQGLFPEEDSLLMGVVGGLTHKHDWKILGPSLKRIFAESSAFLGMQADPRIIDELLEKHWKGLESRIVRFEPTTYQDYPAYLNRYDLTLAPLQSNRFSMGKSALRILELGAVGTPYVASYIAPFHRIHREFHGGNLANGNDFATPALALLADPGLKEKGLEFQKFIYKHYDVRETAKNLHLILRSARVGQKILSVQDLLDKESNISSFRFPLKSTSPCPCGCGKAYGQSCVPAYGRL